MKWAWNPFTSNFDRTGDGGGGGTSIISITGNDLTPQTPDVAGNFNLLTANSTVKFIGSTNTETLDFGLSNLIIGSDPSAGFTVAGQNVALGIGALSVIASGNSNACVGYNSALSSVSGTNNACLGFESMRFNVDGNQNVSVGARSMHSATSTFDCTAVGNGALEGLTGGFGNIALGALAGSALTGSDSANIDIGHHGVAGDSGIIRLGTLGDQTAFFAQGISGVTPALTTQIVVIDSVGQLGSATAPSGIATQYNADTGNAVPSAGVLSLLGQQAGTVPVMVTTASGSTLNVEDRTWLTQYVVDQSSTVGLRGTYTTIQAAVTAATAPANVYIRPGLYVENVTMKDGVNLIGLSKFSTTICKLTGKITIGSGALCRVVSMTLAGNNDYFCVNTSANITFDECLIITSVGDGISNSSGTVTLNSCTGVSITNGAYFTNSNGTITFADGNFGATGGTSTHTGSGGITFISTRFEQDINYANSSSGSIRAFNTAFGNQARAFHLTISGDSIINEFFNCSFESDAGTSITCNTPAVVTLSSCNIFSSATSVIDGTGTVHYSGISFSSTSSHISTTTQQPGMISNDRKTVVTPGAYPYTTAAQDNLIIVDSSVARTIIPLANPLVGQTHTIKDNGFLAAINPITITPSGKNIDNAASIVINSNGGSMTIVYNGTQWNVI